MTTSVARAMALLVLFAFPGLTLAETEYFLSERKLFKVSYTSSIQPVEINRIHEWVLHIETVDGDVVEDAEVSIEGGMPAHDHGLPTQPRVTEYLGAGNYRVQGIRFHMSGEWLLTIGINDGRMIDTAAVVILL